MGIVNWKNFTFYHGPHQCVCEIQMLACQTFTGQGTRKIAPHESDIVICELTNPVRMSLFSHAYRWC